MDKRQLIEAVLNYPYATPEALIDAHAKEMTLGNMGQSLADYAHLPRPTASRPVPSMPDLSTVVTRAYDEFYQSSESDEIAKCIADEHRSWVKSAKKDVTKVVKGGLPLTLANARLAWEEKGPFAR